MADKKIEIVIREEPAEGAAPEGASSAADQPVRVTVGGQARAGGGPARTPQQTRRYQAQNRLRRLQRARRAKDLAAKDEERQRRAAERQKQLDEKAAAREKQQQERAAAAQKQAGDADRSRRSAVGTAAGGAIGRRAGAAIGTAVGGPVGAAVGGVIGGVVGGRIGGRVAGGGSEEGEGGGLPGGAPGVGEVAEQAQKALQLVGRAAAFAGEGLEKVARGDAIGAFAQGADKAAEALDEIPVVGKVAGEALRTFTTVVTTANRVLAAFAERGRELGGYNGRIAAAASQQDVTRILSDIREAQRMGDSYARLIDKQTEFEEVLKALLMPIKEWIVDKLPKVIDTLLDILQASLKLLEYLPAIGDGAKEVGDDVKKIREDMRRDREKPAGDIFSAWLAAPVVGPPFAAIPAAPPGPLGLPIIAPLVPPGP